MLFANVIMPITNVPLFLAGSWWSVWLQLPWYYHLDTLFSLCVLLPLCVIDLRLERREERNRERIAALEAQLAEAAAERGGDRHE